MSLPTTFESSIRERIQSHSSNSAHFQGNDVFIKLDRGHWGLREKYKYAKTFSSKPIETKPTEEIDHYQPIELENSEDDVAIAEDGKQLRNIEEVKVRKEHYRYEGRLKASQIKRIKLEKGYTCEACGMSFANRYPGLGDEFIECHHKVPYANLTAGESRKLNLDDFMVLCSNCHKMIHRLEDPGDLDGLRAILAKGN